MARRNPNTFRPTPTPDTVPFHGKVNPNPASTPVTPVAGDRLFQTDPAVTYTSGTPAADDIDTVTLTYTTTNVR